MAVIELSDELQRVTERQVAEGRAATAAAFLEEAVRRLVDETTGEEDELSQAAEAASADVEAGRYVTVTTQDDERHVHEAMIARLRTRLSTPRLIGLPAHQNGGRSDRRPPARQRA